MSRYKAFLQAGRKAAKLRPNPLVLNGEAKLELNSLGVLELRSKEGEVRLSLAGVQELHKALVSWYGDDLYKGDDDESV